MLTEAVEHANLDPQTKKKMVFYTRQFIDAMSTPEMGKRWINIYPNKPGYRPIHYSV